MTNKNNVAVENIDKELAGLGQNNYINYGNMNGSRNNHTSLNPKN